MFQVKKSWVVVACVLIVFVVSFFLKSGHVVDNDMNPIPEELEKQDILNQKQELGSFPKPITIYVDVKGEVNKPGVYLVDGEIRVDDVIKLAEGFTNEANKDGVNLAQKVYDEMVIHVPKIGEELQTNTIQVINSNAKILINRASIEEIAQLNGIGSVKATAIVEYREQNGPFRTIEDLMLVSGIGEKTIEKIRDQVQVP